MAANLGALKGTFYRSHSQGTDALTTEGSRLHGGRFNHPGRGALYLSSDLDTSLREHERARNRIGFLATKPFRVSECRLGLSKVVDLCAEGAQADLGVAEKSLSGEDVEATRELGTELREAGVEAIVYPSSIDPSVRNIVVFMENLADPAQVRLIRTFDSNAL